VIARRSVVLAVIAVIVAGVWLYFGRSPTVRHAPRRPAASQGAVSPASSPPTAAAPLGHPTGEEPSRLADDLNSASGDIHADLRILNEIFRQYRSSTRLANPVGENAEITAVLTGRNRLNFAFIPPNHPAINSRGELCDRWGTPFFFHQLSGEQMEIRSAGPDRQLWTSDDQVLTPGLSHPQL
jgi:hypothetical protein